MTERYDEGQPDGQDALQWDDLAVTTPSDDLLDVGRAALRSGDAAAARQAFERALAEAESGDLIEGLARAAYLDLDFPQAISEWERAYAVHRQSGDQLGAVRVARTLAAMYTTISGDLAVASGWLARAQTLLAEGADSPERGWVALNRGMFEPDRGRKDGYFTEALAVARRLGDRDLEFVALAYLGASLVHADRTEEGMALLDEALAAVAGNEVDTSASWRRSSASCSRRANTPTTCGAPTSGSVSARRSRSGGTSPPCRRSAGPTTAVC
jgi:tetratricopeptide (TPR) repeat protein